jgi:hypothetical protein
MKVTTLSNPKIGSHAFKQIAIRTPLLIAKLLKNIQVFTCSKQKNLLENRAWGKDEW